MKHLFLIVALTVCVCTLFGCGESIEAENDALLLEPAWDFQLRELHIDPGSLIRPEDVPVVSIEITRQDAENVWWRLTVNPAPTHEDLVVGVYNHNEERYVIPKHQNHSMEYQQPRPTEFDHTVAVSGTSGMLSTLWYELARYINATSDWGAGDLPPFITDDGYAVPHGFKFTYYHTSPQDETLIVQQAEIPDKPNTPPE